MKLTKTVYICYVKIITYGGWLKSKSKAIILGIFRALSSLYSNFRFSPIFFKKGGFLTYDVRRKEIKNIASKKLKKSLNSQNVKTLRKRPNEPFIQIGILMQKFIVMDN
jgi:ribosomal protein S9